MEYSTLRDLALHQPVSGGKSILFAKAHWRRAELRGSRCRQIIEGNPIAGVKNYTHGRAPR
jgi:hypothetical protein